MHPWLLEHPPVSMYGVCIVAGLLCAWIWARANAQRAGMDASRIDLLMPLLVGTGLLGAWTFGRLTDAVTEEQAHGAVLVGSLLVATGAGIGYALASRIPLGVLGDICAGPLALGIGIGRVGCFFAGCCYGKVCMPAWGIRFPAGSFAYLGQMAHGELPAGAGMSLPVYPTQLMEAALCVILALLLWRFKKPGVAGERFLAMGIGYAGIRFAVEFLRGDNPPVLGGLTFSQCASIGIAAMAATTWWFRRALAARWRLDRAAALPGQIVSGPASWPR